MQPFPLKSSFRPTAIYPLILGGVFPPDMSFSGEAHDFYEIVFVESGRIEVTEDEKVYLLGEGDMILHAPMEFHRIRSAEGTTPHVQNLSFAAEGTLPPGILSGVLPLAPAERREFAALFRFCHERWAMAKEEACVAEEAAALLTLFLLHISKTEGVYETEAVTAPAAAYRTLVRLMTTHVSDNLSLEELAAAGFVSTSYLKSLFARYAGIGPRTYYNNLRLQEAQRLLSLGFTVAETGERMHFSSPNNFIRFFKSKTGATPLQYKRGE
jgi:AraC-like DNA-binding protein